MGAACCVAAKDRTIICGSPVTAIQGHSHHSPSWSFRWDNRGRVAGEETAVDWLNNEGRDDDRMEVKSSTTVEATVASDDGSPQDSLGSLTWQKSPTEGNGKSILLPSSDPIAPGYLGKVKESFGSPSVSSPSPMKLSSSVPCVSSLSPSPLSPQSHMFPGITNPSRGHVPSPARPFGRQVSDSRILEYRSPAFSISEEPSSFLPSVWSNESTRGSHCGSSESWSVPAFSEPLVTTPRERWSFDSEASSILSHDKVSRSSGHKHRSSFDLEACGICSKLLTERSSWSWTTQKLIALNEIAVAAVLTCGHVYHGECLEYMTPDINKYDPACPVCTFGEKKTANMCEKALRAELESMTKRKSRKGMVASDPRTHISFDRCKTSGNDGRRGSKNSSSSSTRTLAGTPFLRRHFSIGSGTSRSASESQSTPRKSFFWANSSKY